VARTRKHLSSIFTRPSLLQSRALFLFTALNVLLFVSSCSKQEEAVKLEGNTMGTTYHITMVNPPYNINMIDLQQDIDIELAGLEGIFSTYDPNSELSLLNAMPEGQWHSVSTELLDVINMAQDVSGLSGGAFDITVGPLVALWGFGSESNSPSTVPDESALESLQQNVGYKKIQFKRNEQLLQKSAAVEIDLSAIAKGYAVDRVAEILNTRRIDNYMVEIGGEVKTRGVNPNKSPWRLGVEKPVVSLQKQAQAALLITGKGVATSGDYHNFVLIEGQQFSHTIDPRTGKPITHGLASVTVVNDSVAMADAWATALSVLGEKEGRQLANAIGLKAYFIQKEPDGNLAVSYSNGFEEFLDEAL